MGGQAMVNILGSKLTVTLGKSCSQTVTDSRIKAAAGYVPYMGQTFLPSFCDNQDGAEAVTRPYLAISGTTDTTAPIRVTQQAVNRFQGTRYLIELVDVPHTYEQESPFGLRVEHAGAPPAIARRRHHHDVRPYRMRAMASVPDRGLSPVPGARVICEHMTRRHLARGPRSRVDRDE